MNVYASRIDVYESGIKQKKIFSELHERQKEYPCKHIPVVAANKVISSSLNTHLESREKGHPPIPCGHLKSKKKVKPGVVCVL